MLGDQSLDAVALATPVSTHAELARQVLEAGKHCFVEKPLGRSVEEAEQVVEAARAGDRVLMVGHLLEYHPGVEKMNELIEAGELGEVRYIYSNRLNLGQLRRDENALWSLGAHDVSVILRLAAEVVGSKRMATFDDMELERKLSVYDKGFDEDYSSYGEYIARSGDIFSPHVPNEEPLRIECRHFLDCVRGRARPRSGAESGLRVVRVLEALQRSLQESSRAAPV